MKKKRVASSKEEKEKQTTQRERGEGGVSKGG